jgi:probable F420-dependent oxidoreductase
MQLGCDLPYFASVADTRTFAEAAEELGYDHLGFSEHVASSRTTEFPPGFSFEDPWHECLTMLAFLAAVTSTIGLSSAMALATLRPPVLLAKQAAEVDLLSNGRLRLGVSVGWNREEQQALGVDPATRGRRIEELVPLLRRLWTEDAVTHAGEAFTLDQVGIHPRPDRSVPIWMGGGGFDRGGQPSAATIRRAARLADGFKLMAPTGADVDGAVRTAALLHELADAEGRTIEVEARLLTQLTPPDEWGSVVRRYRESGMFTHVGLGNRIAGGTVADQVALISDVERRIRSEL